MRGSLGEKIGEAAYADVHAWAPGWVLKLFKSGFPRRHSWWEARMTRAAFAAGAPAPEAFDEVTLEGRFGVVLQRLDGPTLSQLSRSGAMTPEQTGAILATLAISVHRTPPASILRGVMSFYPSWPRKAPPIRSGRAQSMRPCSPSTRGWPGYPKRR